MDPENKELLKLKQQEEFRKSVHNSHNLIKRDTQDIPGVCDLDDRNKGYWVEHDDDDFSKAFDGLLDYTNDDEDLGNLDWNSVSYEVYGPDWYALKYPGFSDATYEILAKSSKEENKLMDNTIPPLKITNEPVTVTFD